MKRIFVLIAILVFAIGAISFANAASYDKTEKFVVNVDTKLNVRCGPGMNYEVFAKLRKGTVIDVAGYKNGWAIVLHDFGNGYAETVGYVDPDYLVKYTENSSSECDNTTKYIVKKDMKGWLNVRSSASKRSGRIGKLYAGDVVHVVSKGKTWSKILYNGKYAYVMTKFITTAK